MAAIVGAAGLKPTLEAVRQGRLIALANKECLVSAGDIFMAEVARAKATLLQIGADGCKLYQAGARMPLLICQRGDVLELNAEGIAIGLDDGPVFEKSLRPQEIAMSPGTRLVFGNDALHRSEGLLDLLRQHSPRHTNMFMNVCQPASHPRRSSAPRPEKRRFCHSAWLMASDRRKIRVARVEARLAGLLDAARAVVGVSSVSVTSRGPARSRRCRRS